MTPCIRRVYKRVCSSGGSTDRESINVDALVSELTYYGMAVTQKEVHENKEGAREKSHVALTFHALPWCR